jgi:hypothetical protein
MLNTIKAKLAKHLLPEELEIIKQTKTKKKSYFNFENKIRV